MKRFRIVTDELIDMIASDTTEVCIQPDIAGGYKCYINVDGETIVRIGRLKKEQITYEQTKNKSPR